jgi:hypothetical protein
MCTAGVFYRGSDLGREPVTFEALNPLSDCNFEKRALEYFSFMAGQSSRPLSQRFHPVARYYLSALYEFRDLYRVDPKAGRCWFREFLKRVPPMCPFCEWRPGFGCPVPGYRLGGLQ